MSSEQSIFKFNVIKFKPRLNLSRLFYGLSFLLAAYCSLLTATPAAAQKIGFLVPEKNSTVQFVNEKIAAILSEDFIILDDSLVSSAASGVPVQNVFNLSTEEAQNLGKAIGCGFFVAGKAETLRRASLSRPTYYESYAVVYLVSSRTGRLIFWKLLSFEAGTPAEAEKELLSSIENLARGISVNIKASKEKEINETSLPKLAELPAENSPESKNFRPPLPYRRFKPAYTKAANFYNVAATVDATVDLDESGKVLRVEITRWAGYGLDESVAETIRKMQWQPALRNGKPLPIRVLLRYNFKKLEIEE